MAWGRKQAKIEVTQPQVQAAQFTANVLPTRARRIAPEALLVRPPYRRSPSTPPPLQPPGLPARPLPSGRSLTPDRCRTRRDGRGRRLRRSPEGDFAFSLVSTWDFWPPTGTCVLRLSETARRDDWLTLLDARWPCIPHSVSTARARFCASRPDRKWPFFPLEFRGAQSKNVSNH